MSAVNRALALGVALAPCLAVADSTSGIDTALFRSSYDSNGAFGVESGRLLPKRDLSLKASLGYGRAPIRVPVPGIGDAGGDLVLDQILALDLAFAMTLTDRVELGIDVAAYRTSTGAGYGDRGRFRDDSLRSTGLVALRPLSNIDQSASPNDESAYLGVGLAGPLDARAGLKLGLVQRERVAVALLGSLVLPFGEDEMLLGDRGIVFEPALAIELSPSKSLRLLAHAAARFRKRTILEGYDAADPMQSPDDARVFLDVGSELVTGVATVVQATDRLALAVEGQLFTPLPAAASYGSCVRYSFERCSKLERDDYFGDASRGDLAAIVTGGALLRISGDVTATLTLGGSPIGARGEALRVATGIVWAPQPAGTVAPGGTDRDGDRIADIIDACPDEREDRDGNQDEDGCIDRDNDGDGLSDGDDRCPNEAEDRDDFKDDDGCPEADNDGDTLPDVVDRCAEQAEDVDGFEDDDGCPEADNDDDGFADADDRCPNDAETPNGVDDTDGCPDVRTTTGPEERPDRIDLKGSPIAFARNTATLTATAKQLLVQVAAIVKQRRLAIRVEVHVPLGTRARGAAQIAAQKRKDRTLSQRRAKAILDFLLAQGVPVQQVQAVGLGSDRPLGTNAPTDAGNERVDFIKAQQGGTP